MLPGPTIVRKCKNCEGFLIEETLASGNTFGARFWTDGKREAPMLPDYPWLAQCPHCKAVFWLDEQDQVAEIEPWDSEDVAKKFPTARPAKWPSLKDYFSALQNKPLNEEKERYLRMYAWHAGNQPRRGKEAVKPLARREVDNLRALAMMFDENNDEDRFFKAEVMRELGEFVEAKRLLAKPFGEHFDKAVKAITDLVEQGIWVVKEIPVELE